MAMIIHMNVFSSSKILQKAIEMALSDLSKSGGTNPHLLNVVLYSAQEKHYRVHTIVASYHHPEDCSVSGR
jgi:hypothetical protein